MKSIYLNLVMLLIGVVAFAQSSYTGRVVDTKKQPIAFANIAIYKVADSTFVKGGISNKNGVFLIKSVIKEPSYIKISFVGFKPYKINLRDKNNLGKIILKENKEKLKEVLIVARKRLVEQKIDRLVFNIANTTAASGGNALDALRVTPGVNVQNDVLSVIGRGTVRVMIDDRIVQLSGEGLLSYLSSIASDDIKSIEVITAPPAKYDAEGNSGLINIILKKAKADSWNNQIRSSYIQTSYPAVRLGNTFSYNHGKVRFLASLTGEKGQTGRQFNSEIYYPEGLWAGNTSMKKKKDFISGRFGFDYQLSNKASIGVLYAGTTSNKDASNTNNTIIYNTNAKKIGAFTSEGFNDKKGQDHSLNAHYIQKLDTLGRKLSVDIDYFNYQNPQNTNFISKGSGSRSDRLKANNVGNQKINNYSAKIDIEHPFKWIKLSYGAKVTFTKTDNLVNFYNLNGETPILDASRSDHFAYDENIQALYFDIAKPFSKKWQVKMGLRLEATQTKGASKTNAKPIERHYTKLFPAFYLSYVKNRNNIFNFSYSRRIKRPSFWRLNPFRFYLNALSYTEGNPFLSPSFSHNFELKYIYKNRWISEVFSQLITAGFGQIPTVDPGKNQQIYRQTNFYDGQVYGIKETFLYRPTRWWNTTSQATAYFIDGKTIGGYDPKMDYITGFGMQLYTQQSFFFDAQRQSQLSLTFMYSGIQRKLIAETAPSFTMNIEFIKKFLNKKLLLTVGAYDIFKTQASDLTTYVNAVKQVLNTYSDSRYFKISLSYSFGNQKIRVKERKFGNTKEQQRAEQ